MQLDGLKQAPFNVTLMGALSGTLRYYRIAASDPYLYGASGHAFLMNVHSELCPSGPYCWNRQPAFALLRNVGLDITPLGYFDASSPPSERAAVERRLREALTLGAPCFLVNMEFQLVTGYDETGFLTAQPWPGHDFPPAHLTFGSWSELGDEIHLDFHIVDALPPLDRLATMTASLRHAVDLWRHPERHSRSPYSVGGGAYENWEAAVRAGEGGSHGNWWNGMVWSESRRMAGEYLTEVAPILPLEAEGLAAEYAAIGSLLQRASEKALADEPKLALLGEAHRREAACIDRIEALLPRLP
ncbi:MAG TPA: hypothetical protein VLH79_05050 [Chthonomonadales bacterium]|nr:hypothetical protein [Chthonomonadales bacterium]